VGKGIPVTEMNRKILNTINTPDDIKKIDKVHLEALSEELREMLLSNVSNNGGHLASNLGVVELTIALLRVFDMKSDRIVWDVGHQSYTYKILTGRRDTFESIRKKGGLSGFPKRTESEYDFFDTGHSSTSISAALGLARASRIKNIDNYSIAVVGDGALTGGMAFEALNDAGVSGENIIVLLNDNEMSITKNVGGFAEYFSRMRSSRIYSDTNSSVKKGVEKIPLIGKLISRMIHKLKSSLKYLFSQNMLFEEMGFHYLGPVDGHDIKKMEKILIDAKKIKGPVLVHAVTVKGKGYKKAEEEPVIYHGVGKFDKENGLEEKSSDNFSNYLGKSLLDFASKDDEITVVCPAVTLGCGLLEFSNKFPERFFDVGIAEQHAVTLAAGIACGGLKPVVAGYSTFMQRAYDQILHDVCLMNLHVVFTFDRAGIVGYDGATHQGVYDLGYLSNMPNIKIFAPSDKEKLKSYLQHSLNNEKGPVIIRYSKGNIDIPKNNFDLNPEKAKLIKTGDDGVIFSYGKMLEEAYKVSDKFEAIGIKCSLVDISCLKPIDDIGIKEYVAGKKFAVCIEDVVESGSCSLNISKILKDCKKDMHLFTFNLGEKFDARGTRDDILKSAGLTGEQIFNKLKSII